MSNLEDRLRRRALGSPPERSESGSAAGRRGFFGLLAASLLVACQACQCGSARAPSENLSADTPCAEGCESNLWPRVIVGLALPVDSSIAAGSVRARLRLADGRVLTGHAEGCPDTPGLTCSYSFFTAPRDRQATLLLELPGAEELRAEVTLELGRFNHCGREIVYLEAAIEEATAPKIGPVRLVSPCDESVSKD